MLVGSAPFMSPTSVNPARGRVGLFPTTTTSPRSSLGAAERLLASPRSSAAYPPGALDALPQDWLPMGHTQRHFEARMGLVKVTSGTAEIQRNQDEVSIRTSKGNFTLKSDPQQPGRIIAVTPKGTFKGTIEREGNELRFTADDGKHGLTMEKKKHSLRIDTEGFGALDLGHLNVMDS